MTSENDRHSCSTCQDLLAQLQCFFDMLESYRKNTEGWLTVEEIAEELKISKTVVYRLIRNNELEAINIVENNGKVAQRGHYRIKRNSLNDYLENKKVKPSPSTSKRKTKPRHLPKIKNHLGI